MRRRFPHLDPVVREVFGRGTASLLDTRLPVAAPPESVACTWVLGGGAESPASDIPQVPGFEVLSELGRGGMGVVFKARQVKLNRLVALKMIRPRGQIHLEDRARFRQEAEAVARLRPAEESPR